MEELKRKELVEREIQKLEKQRGNRMTRPNRYPYTKSQWEEETTSVYFGDGTSLKTLIENNRITGVINVSLQCE